ncbi:Spectrin beta chain, non-erythrocytic 1 [Cichlidogyrus casuarinus]|uniref:Spectrin beta chain, non-erythrocytic 1 n=1 Tax=Cichlidogyrus casuarinus TaxID=1844966 RepID=A0ABD2Q183_9PLAT
MEASSRTPVLLNAEGSLSPFISPNEQNCECACDKNGITAAKLYEQMRISGLAAERERVQKKTFTKWANCYLKGAELRIRDLYHDLSDGKILLALLEIISGRALFDSIKEPPTPGRMRIHNLENVEKVLKFLAENHIHLENLGAHDIVDGNPRLILGLMWMIILRFQIQDIMIMHPYEEPLTFPVQPFPHESKSFQQKSARPILRRFSKDGLLLWCQLKVTDYSPVQITNFSTSWCDGLAFNAIIHKHFPQLFDFDSLLQNEPISNLEHAFMIAENRLGIPRLFDPEDILRDHPDEKSILTYVASYYHYFTRQKIERVNNKRISNLINQISSFFAAIHAYETSVNDLLAWIYTMIEELDDRAFASELIRVQQQMVAFTNYRLLEKPPRLTQKANLEVEIFNLRNRMQSVNLRLYNPPSHLSLARINRAWISLEKAENKREAALRDELIRLERLDLLASKFMKKAHLRETWILEKQRYLDTELPLADRSLILATQQRYGALENEICTYTNRMNDLHFIAAELDHGAYHNHQEILSMLHFVDQLWTELIKCITSKKILVDNQLYVLNDLQSSDDLLQWLSCIEQRLLSGSKDFEANSSATVEGLLRNHEIIEADIRTVYQKIAEYLDRDVSQSMLSISDNAATLDETENQLRDTYSRVVDLAECKRLSIERSGHLWQTVMNLNREAIWLSDKHKLARKLFTSFNTVTYEKSIRTYKKFDVEIVEHKPIKDDVLARAQEVLQAVNHNSKSVVEIKQKLGEVETSWKSLLERNSILRKHWSCMKQLASYLSECDELEAWLNSKIDMLYSSLHMAQNSSSSDTVAISSKCLSQIAAELPQMQAASESLSRNGQDMIHDSEEQFQELRDNNLFENEEIKSSDDNYSLLRILVTERREDLDRLMGILKEALTSSDASFAFLKRIHKLLLQGQTIFHWIKTRDHGIDERVLKATLDLDVTRLVGPNGQVDEGVLDDFQSISFKFNKLGKELADAANEVRELNM